MTDSDFTKENEILNENEAYDMPAADDIVAEGADTDVQDDIYEAEKTSELPLGSSDINSEKNSRNYEVLVGYAEESDSVAENRAFNEESINPKHQKHPKPQKQHASTAVSEAVKSVDEAFKLNSDVMDKIYFAILAVVAVFDFFAAHLFMRKQAFNVSEKILEALGFDALKFTSVSFSQIAMGLGYFVSLLAGGLVIFILLKILTKLFTRFALIPKSEWIPAALVSVFFVIFAIGSFVMFAKHDTLLSTSVYNWGCPAMAYIGGLAFYFASKLHIGIEY